MRLSLFKKKQNKFASRCVPPPSNHARHTHTAEPFPTPGDVAVRVRVRVRALLSSSGRSLSMRGSCAHEDNNPRPELASWPSKPGAGRVGVRSRPWCAPSSFDGRLISPCRRVKPGRICLRARHSGTGHRGRRRGRYWPGA